MANPRRAQKPSKASRPSSSCSAVAPKTAPVAVKRASSNSSHGNASASAGNTGTGKANALKTATSAPTITAGGRKAAWNSSTRVARTNTAANVGSTTSNNNGTPVKTPVKPSSRPASAASKPGSKTPQHAVSTSSSLPNSSSSSSRATPTRPASAVRLNASKSLTSPATYDTSPARMVPGMNSRNTSTTLRHHASTMSPRNPMTTMNTGTTPPRPHKQTQWVMMPTHPHQHHKHRPTTAPALRDKYEIIMSVSNRNDRELRETAKKLRMMVLREGLPEGSEICADTSTCSLRGRIWKLLLGIYRVSAPEYLGLVERGPSQVYDKIKNDTFRTLKSDKRFLTKVSEDMLSRVLNAFVWKTEDLPPSPLLNLHFSYVQGMNVLLAPFLFVMPELDAFFTFTHFITSACPLYVQPALEGVHFAIKLVDQCLRIVEPELWEHLKKHGLSAKVYAMPSLLTFSACTPPLVEVLKLWDFYLAYGMHLNVLGVVAQLCLLRNELLASPSPMKLLRTLPALQARPIISGILNMLPAIPEYLYDLMVRHTYDPMVEVALRDLEADESDVEEEQMDEYDQEEMEDMEHDHDMFMRHEDEEDLVFDNLQHLHMDHGEFNHHPHINHPIHHYRRGGNEDGMIKYRNRDHMERGDSNETLGGDSTMVVENF